jgi:hypothetical protein
VHYCKDCGVIFPHSQAHCDEHRGHGYESFDASLYQHHDTITTLRARQDDADTQADKLLEEAREITERMVRSLTGD